VKEVIILPSEKEKAKMLFKQLKARIKKWDDLTDKELQLMLKHYPSLFPCEFKEDDVPCGYPAYVIILAKNQNKSLKFCACKVHYVRLTLALLHKGYEVKWIKRWNNAN